MKARNASIDGALAKARFNALGYDFAEELLGCYLDNKSEGYEYRIRTSHFDKVVATQNVIDTVSLCLDSIKDQARQNPEIGATREITSDYLGAGPTENEDVANALGHFDIGVGSDTTFSTPEGGTGVVAEILYKVYIYEYYNFDQKSKWSSPGNFVGNEMRLLEEAGWARSFRVRGETVGVIRWSGTL
ncbi:hypothetical protein [Streptomyces roseolus]|uniref:hypothetical protein n=1 Tax=Streptomyces roseolus TaxID=67358 RepID=UPI003656D658